MKRLSLLIVANNNSWSSWDEKIKELRDWFAPKVELDVTLHRSQYTNIPFEEYTPGRKGVDRDWYDENVTILARGYDLVLFVLNLNDWKAPLMRGWRTDRDDGPVELQIAAEENEKMYREGKDVGGTFFNYGRHEIIHALFLLTGQEDTTHFWWDRWELENALAEVKFKENNIAERIAKMKQLVYFLGLVVNLLQRLILKKKQQSPKITVWADAIKEYEGWFPPSPDRPNGSRSYRNNNPGNLRYANQLGTVGKDRDNFAVFASEGLGYAALLHQLKLALNGKSKVYYPSMTLVDFFRTYAPSSDNNHPEKYAVFVAQKLGVTTHQTLQEIFTE